MLTIIWVFSKLQSFCNSNIKDYWSQITVTNIIIMKTFEILWELPECDTETRSEKMLLEKWHQYTCSMQGCHKPSVCKKMQYLWSAVNWSAIKWGMPVLWLWKVLISREAGWRRHRNSVLPLRLFCKSEIISK